MVLGLHPKIARSARANQPSPFSRAMSIGRSTGTGRLRDVLDETADSLGLGESVSGMAVRCQPSASRTM
jgi:hypothetical protein